MLFYCAYKVVGEILWTAMVVEASNIEKAKEYCSDFAREEYYDSFSYFSEEEPEEIEFEYKIEEFNCENENHMRIFSAQEKTPWVVGE